MHQFKKILSLVLMVLIIFGCTVPYITTYAAPNMRTGALVPGKFSNVSYTVKKVVKTMPATLNYSTQLMELPDLLGKNSNIKTTNIQSAGIGVSTPTSLNQPGVTQSGIDIDTSQITPKDLKYPIGASYMILNKDVSTFQPKSGEVYLDNTKKSAVKVIGAPVYDAVSGKKLIPIEKPPISEIFESYKIPEQRIKVNKANVSYVAPTVADEDGASYIDIQQIKEARNVSLASAGDTSVSFDDDCMVVKIKNVTLYEYPEPSKDDKEKKAGSEQYEENDKATDAKEGYYEDKEKSNEKDGDNKPDNYNNLEGVSNEEQLSIKVKIEEGLLKIYKPRAFADVDIGLLEQEIKVGFESDMVSEVTLKGELKFNKVIEKCIFGYDVEIPYGHAFIGVFLIVDAKGQVEVKAKVISEGKMQAGLKAQAILFVPVYVGPFAEPVIDEIKVGFSADGEVQAKIALVPQVGLIICDYEIAVFQLWLALKANAEFHIKTEAGADLNTLDVSGDISGSGHLKLDAYAEFIGYLLGYKYSFFYKEWNLYDNTWTFGNDVEGGGSTLKPLYGTINLQADAYTNKIKGYVNYFDDTEKRSISAGGINFGNSYTGADLVIKIKDKTGKIESVNVTTDSFGGFELDKEVKPQDRISAELSTTITDKSGAKRNLICSAPEIIPKIPFNKFTYVADAFNDIVTGTVSDGYKTKYSGPLTIQKIDKAGRITNSAAIAVNGEFTKPVVLVGGDQIKVTLPFEGAAFPDDPVSKPASLDSLKLFFKRDVANKVLSGSIQNVYEEATSAYKGDVVFKAYNPLGGLINSFGQQKAKVYTYNILVRDKKSPYTIVTKVIETTASTFKTNFECIVFSIEINHDGIKKVISYNPFESLKNIGAEPVQIDVRNPLKDKIDSVINPGDSSWTGVWETEEMGTMVLQQKGNIVTGTLDGGFDNYIVQATVEGNRLSGTISNNLSTQKIDVTLGSDMKTIQGSTYVGNVSTKSSMIAGTKRTLAPSSSIFTGLGRLPWSGVWFTDYGTMILEQEGSIVNGTIGQDESFVSGKLVGNVFSGIYTVDSVRHQVEFTISPDSKALTGRFKLDSDNTWTQWIGSKGK